MRKVSIIAASLALCLSACANPSSQSDPKKSGAHRYFLPASHVVPSSKALLPETTTPREDIINLSV